MAQVVIRALAALLLVAAAACGDANRYAPPPPPEVTVARPLAREVTTYNEFTGHTASLEAVEIRARVEGYLQSVNFDPGSDVEKGQLLFVIEPDLYQARVNQAAADLQGKEAEFRAAQAQLEIAEAIFKRSAGSRTEIVQKTQARDLAKAEVARARATLEAAELDLSYTRIYAPISGRIDRNFVDAGNLVGQGEATRLASIVRYDPIYAYFTASERELLQYRELQRQNRTVTPKGQHNVAWLNLSTEEGFPHRGMVDYSGNRVDPQTGTIEVRAVFPNPDRIILPGLFARVRLPFTREPSLLVPDGAIQMDQGGSYVLVVGAENVVEHRRVTPGATIEGHLTVARTGLRPTDWVVVNGLQRARPGAKVSPKRTTLEAPPDGEGEPGDAAPEPTPELVRTPDAERTPGAITGGTPPPAEGTPGRETPAPAPARTPAGAAGTPRAEATAAGAETTPAGSDAERG